MRLVFFTISVLFVSSSNSAVEKLEEKKDFSIICAFSKSAEYLSKNRFVTDPAERALINWSAIEAQVKTDEVKNVIKTVMAADPKSKSRLLNQAAKDVGLKHWNCKSVKYLF